ncbi:MAG: nucleotidyltransferase domain-containing protein [Candidatus Korarchaeota archaeon]|nr:nucleotidyltransferase domain-containing protein [Candidatus Korarchaeota archaeon]
MELKYYEMNEEEIRKLVEDLRAKLEAYEDIVLAHIHGSFLKGRFRDVDVAIWIKGGKADAFHYTVEVSAELSKEFPVDLHVLNEAPVSFQYQVFTGGRLLFSRDEKIRSEAMDRALKMHLDSKELLRSLSATR